MTLTLGHSPDPDDAFMFYALATHQIETGDLAFEHILQDIQTLNERATRQELDITAVSIHAYAFIADAYALLPSGASMGYNYGPMLVGPRILPHADIASARIAVPGLQTSACLALQLFLQKPAADLNLVVVPFDQIFETLHRAEADLGLIIHEGQLTYKTEGFQLTRDLGQWWFEDTGGLPLPLGGNAIRKALGPELIARVSRLLTESIRFGLEHRAAGVDHALPLGRGLDRAMADRFIGMYVNDWTLDYGEKGRAAIDLFLKRGTALGVVPPVTVEFVS